MNTSKQLAMEPDNLLLCENCARKSRLVWDRSKTKIEDCDICGVHDIVARSLKVTNSSTTLGI